LNIKVLNYIDKSLKTLQNNINLKFKNYLGNYIMLKKDIANKTPYNSRA